LLAVIFAPADEAFGNISSGTLEGLMKDPSKLKEKTDNKQITQSKTHAITPDKMDRLSRKIEENNKPYPLSEEEATPQVPISDETELTDFNIA
jgi:hypothetical protein